MPLTLDQLRDEVLALPADQRHEFITSVRQQDDPSSLELQPSWQAEIQRRLDDLRAGRVKGIPAEDVFAEVDTLVDAV